MRYGKDQKQATRQRIVEAAGRRFKEDGIDGAGVAAVMSDAGLTNGAFFAHFASKDDLFASVIEEELRLQAQTFGALPDGLAGVEQLVRAYLSPEHRDHCDLGCTSAALLDEIFELGFILASRPSLIGRRSPQTARAPTRKFVG